MGKNKKCLPSPAPRPLPTDAMCHVLSYIHVLDRIRIMTTCKDWYCDIRIMCARLSVIAFRYTGQLLDPRQCHVQHHFIPDTEVIEVDSFFRRLMSSESAVKSFHKLFPNLKVISAPDENGFFGFDTSAPTLSRDFIAAYQQSLQCLNVQAISWTRSAPQSFCELTCMTVYNSKNVRLSEKTYPSLRSLKTGPGIEALTRYLPAKLLRLECSVRNIIKIGKADFAANLTHLRLNVLIPNLSSDLSFPNLRSLILKGEAWNSKMFSLMRNLTTHLKAPKLKYLGIFSYYCRLVELVFVFPDIFCFFRNNSDTEPVKKFLQSLPQLDALALRLSRPQSESTLDIVLETQQNIKMFYWDHFPIKSEILKKLLRLKSLRIFGSEIQLKQRESLRHFFQAPLMHQLTHFHAITCSRWTKTSGDEKISDVVEQEIQKLEEMQLKVAALNGYMQDVFAEQLKLLKLCC